MIAARFDRMLRQVLVAPTLAVLLGAAALYWQMRDANRTVAQIAEADDTIAHTIEIAKLMDDQETGLRGYQTTGDPEFLEPYRSAQAGLDLNFSRLEAEARSSGGGNPREIRALGNACDDWRAGFAEPLIATIQAGGKTGDVELNLQGKTLFDVVRRQIANVGKTAQQRRDNEIARWHRQVQRMSFALAGLGLGIGLTIGLYTRRLLREVSRSFRQTNNALRARAEEIFRSEEKLRTTLESIGDGVIACDAEGCVDAMNPVAENLTGWPLAEARRRPIEEVLQLLDERTGQPIEGPASRIRRLNRVMTLESDTVLVRRDGSLLAIDDSGAPIRDKKGNLTGVVVVFRDVTVARRSREALLANEKLAVAGRLAATIAHEIHNPLDSVSNLLFLMDGQSTPEETAHFLSLARQEISRVTQISRAMLSLYREAKAPVAIDVKEMLESILLLMDRRFRDLGVEVESDLPAELVIHGFPAELRQVFTNLLTNAAEAAAAMPSAGATSPHDQPSRIRVRARPCPAGKDNNGLRRDAGVMVTITDEGPGIPASIQDDLFKPFFTTKGERGTGLGLWVSRGIINKLGGSIDFVSDSSPEHHGTTFRVFLAIHPAINLGGD